MPDLRIPNAQLRTLMQEARAEPRLIAKWPDFLKECIRWRLPIRQVLTLFRLNRALKKKIRADSNERNSPSTPFRPSMRNAAVWCEIATADLSQDMPAAWEADPVVTDPGDPLADPPVPPTTRPRKWSEAFIVLERPDPGSGRYFVPLSDGQSYFDIQKVNTLETGGLTVIDIDDVPAPTSEV